MVEDGSERLLRNVGKFVLDCTSSYPIKKEHLFTRLWEISNPSLTHLMIITFINSNTGSLLGHSTCMGYLNSSCHSVIAQMSFNIPALYNKIKFVTRCYFPGGGALLCGGPLSPLVPVAYPPYLWPPLPGLFLPYSPLNLHRPPEALSPESAGSVDRGYTPEKAKLCQYASALRNT